MIYYHTLRKLKFFIGHVPVLSWFVFNDANSIYKKELQTFTNEFINCDLALDEYTMSLWHHDLISYGRFLRNKYLLWHPNNPYTIKKLNKIPEVDQPNSEFHPDNYTGNILKRFIEETKNY